jgi:hypothetical protein
VSERVKTYALGEEVGVVLGFEYEGDGEIESVEAVFAREGTGEEISLFGDANKEASDEGRAARYVARLAARIEPSTSPGEYRCARLFARDRLDDDWDFAGTARMNLVIHVKRAPRRLEITTSEFL